MAYARNPEMQTSLKTKDRRVAAIEGMKVNLRVEEEFRKALDELDAGPILPVVDVIPDLHDDQLTVNALAWLAGRMKWSGWGGHAAFVPPMPENLFQAYAETLGYRLSDTAQKRLNGALAMHLSKQSDEVFMASYMNIRSGLIQTCVADGTNPPWIVTVPQMFDSVVEAVTQLGMPYGGMPISVQPRMPGIFPSSTSERVDVDQGAVKSSRAGKAAIRSMTLSGLIDAYWKSPENKDKEESKRNAAACFKMLKEIFGPDKLVADLSRSDFRIFQSIYLNLPPLNWRRCPPKEYAKFKGLSPADAAELAEELNAELDDGESIPSLNPNSVNKYMSALGQLFSWAEKEGYVAENHTHGLRVPSRQSNKGGFTFEQLKTLFPKDYDLSDPRHWLPLIALYHGCRGNEIAQLDTADVAEVDGFHCMFFTPYIVADGARTKRQSPVKSIKQIVSDRRIPIHPKLLELGFMKYVQSRRDAKKEKLFDYNRYGDSYWEHARKYLGYDWLEKVKDETVSFHSFRHTFKTACRGPAFLHINPRFISELGGWTRGKGAEEGYGEYSPPATLMPILEKVAYPIEL